LLVLLLLAPLRPELQASRSAPPPTAAAPTPAARNKVRRETELEIFAVIYFPIFQSCPDSVGPFLNVNTLF